MKNDEKKARLIKNTVFKSIMVEVNAKLESEVDDKVKRNQIKKFTESRLSDILNTLSKNDLLPKKPVESKQDFEEHILELVNLVRDKLLRVVRKETL
jgi:hypothetical protein